MTEIVPWQVLRSELRVHRDVILSDWTNLISQATTTEPAAHAFVRDHAGMMLCDSECKLVAISELELGADYRPDFVVAEDRSSAGNLYEFIELESPNDRAFTQSGKPSADLVAAIMQIIEWRMWLAANREAAKKLLPSWEFWKKDRLAAKYTIIIGRREDIEAHKHIRNQLAEELSIELRSYDYLTDQLASHCCSPFPNLASTEMHAVDRGLRNQLVNPFRKAISSGIWRSIAPQLLNYHTTANDMKLLVDAAELNPRHADFIDDLTKLPPETRTLVQNQAEQLCTP